MDEKSAVFLDSLDVPFIKIGSGDVNNLRLLKLGRRRTLQN
jgi:sialic acid synthase SpsE